MLSGRWKNDRGSEMILRQKDQRIVGEYITRIGTAAAIRLDPRLRQVTGNLPACDLPQRRNLGAAATGREGAARMERTA